MRETHFQCCGGFIKIGSGSNDKDVSAMKIINFRCNAENDTYELKVIGAYDPLSTMPYKLNAPIQWADDNLTHADTNPTSRTVEDVLALGTIVIESLQLADLATISHFFDSLCGRISLNVDKLLKQISKFYWVILNCTLGAVILWATICSLKYRELERKLCCSFTYWSQLFMPSLGHLLFLPIISILSSVFQCSKSISADLTDSFLDRNCWKGKHLDYAIGSVVALLLYIPLTVYTRHYWQDLQANVHVKAVPLALVVKSILPISLIAASNSLRQESPSALSSIYFTTMTIYIATMVLFHQYHYDRLNLWQILLQLPYYPCLQLPIRLSSFPKH